MFRKQGIDSFVKAAQRKARGQKGKESRVIRGTRERGHSFITQKCFREKVNGIRP